MHLSDSRGFSHRLLADIEARDAERDREYRRKKAEAEEAEREKDAAGSHDDRGRSWQQSLESVSPEERKLAERASDPSLSPAEQKRALAAYTRFLDRKDRDPDDEHFVSVGDPEVIEPLGDPEVNVSREGRRGWIKSFQSGERVAPKLDAREVARRLEARAGALGLLFAEFTEGPGRGRLTAAESRRRDQLAEMVAGLHNDGASILTIAKVIGCHRNTVSNLVRAAGGQIVHPEP